jgi:transposase
LKKYSEQQKLDAVETYRSGDLGLRATAALHNVDVASLRKWVAAYEAIGIAGIQRKRRQTYGLEFKLEVLQRIKSEELSYRQAGALFNVRRFDTIASWERAYDKDGVAGLMPQQPTRREPKASDGAPKLSVDADGAEVPSRQELLEELEALRTENAYLKKLKALVQAQAKSAPEPPRVLRMLFSLRGLSHEQEVEPVFT